ALARRLRHRKGQASLRRSRGDIADHVRRPNYLSPNMPCKKPCRRVVYTWCLLLPNYSCI
ncbi:hypothetical protein XENOCAPTIV_023409, partial [Xenoophorus captivus]